MKNCFTLKYNVSPAWPDHFTNILTLYHIIVNSSEHKRKHRDKTRLKNIHATNQAGLANVYSLLISLLTFQREGWCHSVFVFNSSVLHLLMHTPSATWRERQSWKPYITFALNDGSAPLCFSVWCLCIKDSVSLFSQFLACSLPLVYRLRAVSPM